MRTAFSSILAVTLMTCITACSDNANEPSLATDPAVPSGSGTERAKIEASIKNREEIQELVQSHVGKVVVLDLWALW